MKYGLGYLLPLLTLGAVNASAVDTQKVAEGLAHESQIAISAASGNSSTQTYQVKQLTGYTWDANVAKFGAHYLYGESNGVEAAKNWDFSLRYERLFTQRLAGYVGNAWEGDIFIGYDYRTNVDAGGKYYLIPGDNKIDYLATELGYRYQYEHHNPGLIPSSLTAHFLRVYFEGVVGLGYSTTAKASVELLPDLSDGNNFQTNFEGSVSVALSEIFSLKVAYQGKYRNQPLGAGKKKYDSLFMTALLAKF